eukprot:6688543-Pyramimonas_sp.AAC.1
MPLFAQAFFGAMVQHLFKELEKHRGGGIKEMMEVVATAFNDGVDDVEGGLRSKLSASLFVLANSDDEIPGVLKPVFADNETMKGFLTFRTT